MAITRYVNTASSPGGDGTTNATTGANRAFASLNEAEAAIPASIADWYDIVCEGQNADSARVEFSGTTTTASNYIQVRTDPSATYGRHEGVWSNDHYRIVPSVVGTTPLYLWGHHFRFEGLQVACSNAQGAAYGLIRCRNQNSTADIRIDGCIFDGEGKSGTPTGIQIINPASGATHTIKNCIIMNVTNGDGIEASYDSPNVSVHNSVITNCARGINRMNGTVAVTNCAVFNNTDDFSGTMTVTYTASDDNDISGTGNVDISPGATEADDWAAAFTDYTNGDFSLKSGSPLIDAGIGPALDSNVPTTDIAGTPRSGDTCDIGAFEFVDAGGTYVTVTDSGSGADAIGQIAVALGVSDAGSAVDALPGARAVLGVADAGAGADMVSYLHNLLSAITDTGHGTESLGVSAGLAVQDSGVGTDSAGVAVSILVTDTGSGVDAVTLIADVIKRVTDVGSGIDAIGGITVQAGVSDAGHGADTAGVRVALTVTDLGSAVDLVSTLQAALVTIADAGHGADTVGPVSVSLAVADSCQGIDVIGAVQALLRVLDAGAGVDIVSSYEPDARIRTITATITAPGMTITVTAPGIKTTIT